MTNEQQPLYKNTGLKVALVEEIIGYAKQYGIDKLYLFGSRARGDYKERSDIDLAFIGGDAKRFILAMDEDTYTLLSFDVVDLGKPVQEELLESIRSEGVLLYTKN
ncbi:nucleotidyltransferase family protein [Phascolarctobacterium sp.]|uniref:nucleotidyltransferase family protein n=1 Tax=Phascolarctobacterium sp. TaxID=2049039 RepID=UPI00386D4D5C